MSARSLAARGVSRTSSVKAAQRRFNLFVTSKLTAARLRKTFQNCRQIVGVYDFGFTVISRKIEHSARNLILAVCRQLTYRFKRFLKQFGHAETYRISCSNRSM